MLNFLKPFVNSINRIETDGISCNFNGEVKRIYVHALCCCVDCMQSMIQYNGYYGCSWCLHPGQRVFHNRGATIKYTLTDELTARRTAEEMFEQMGRLGPTVVHWIASLPSNPKV